MLNVLITEYLKLKLHNTITKSKNVRRNTSIIFYKRDFMIMNMDFCIYFELRCSFFSL